MECFFLNIVEEEVIGREIRLKNALSIELGKFQEDANASACPGLVRNKLSATRVEVNLPCLDSNN